MSASQPSGHAESTGPDEIRDKAVDPSSEALTTLRGSSVGKVNTRRVGQVIFVVALVTLLVLAIVFVAAGVHRNNQISSLHHQGVRKEMTVTACALLIGGTGSTPAGFSCQGIFTLGAHRYLEFIPGSAKYATGQKLPIIVVPNDPALLAPANIVAQEHTSSSVFILPAILFVAFLLLLGGGLVFMRRRRGAQT